MKKILLISASLLFIMSCANQKTINIHGTAFYEISPDYVSLTFSIITKDKNYDECQKQNISISEKVFTVLKDQYEVTDDNISTLNYTLKEELEYNGVTRKYDFKGYISNNSLNIRIYEIDKYKEILIALMDAGINQVSSVSFGIDDYEEIRLKALELAFKNARNKAELLALQGGAKLGEVLIISESVIENIMNDKSILLGYKPGLELRASMTNTVNVISSGTTSVKADINVLFELR